MYIYIYDFCTHACAKRTTVSDTVQLYDPSGKVLQPQIRRTLDNLLLNTSFGENLSKSLNLK